MLKFPITQYMCHIIQQYPLLPFPPGPLTPPHRTEMLGGHLAPAVTEAVPRHLPQQRRVGARRASIVFGWLREVYQLVAGLRYCLGRMMILFS